MNGTLKGTEESLIQVLLGLIELLYYLINLVEI